MLAIWNERSVISATEQQLAGQARCIKNRGWLSTVEIEEIQRAIDNEGEKGAQSTEAEEVELNGNVQYQVTQTRQEEVTEPEEVDEVDGTLDQELEGEERHVLEVFKNKLVMTEDLEPVNLRYICKK